MLNIDEIGKKKNNNKKLKLKIRNTMKTQTNKKYIVRIVN